MFIDFILHADHFDVRQAPTLMAFILVWGGRLERERIKQIIVLDQDKCYENKQGHVKSDWVLL